MSSPPSSNSGGLQETEEARFPEIGDVFLEKYEIEGLLGEGGYAKVYLATQLELGRKVAIKVLSPNVQNIEASESNTGSVEALAVRFEREAKLVSRLRSPYTVTMYDYGQTAEDLLYMVLEYIDGITLDEEDFPIEPRRISKILRQVLKSLQEAHSEGLLHRDLKPANIMLYEHLGERDQVKLLDFGIAKLIGERHADQLRNEADLTGDAALLGTPRYMSPEQIRGEEVGPPRDIYSLGLIAYEMLVGKKAIDETDSIKIMAKHISATPLQVPDEPEYDTMLARIIDKMLAKRVEDRYGDVESVIEDLKRFERQLEASPEPSGATSAPSSVESSSESDGGGRWLIAALVLAVAGGALALLFATGRLQLVDQKTTTLTDEPTASPGNGSGTDVQKVGGAAATDTGFDTGEADVSEDDEADVGDVRGVVEITSDPEGAAIYLGERKLGVTPLKISRGSIDFPATVRGELDGETVERTVESPGTKVDLDFEQRDQRPDDGARPAPEASKPTPLGGPETEGEGRPASDEDDESQPAAAGSDDDVSETSEETETPDGPDSAPASEGDESDSANSSDGGEEGEDPDEEPEFLPVE